MECRYFIERSLCPACKSDQLDNLYKNSYVTEEIRNYINEFYNKQGGVEWIYLNDAIYSLLQCKSCSLIFQQYIPNDFLMEKLYSEWIDSEKVFAELRDSIDYPLSNLYAIEINRILNYFNRPASGIKILDFGMGWARWAMMAKSYGCDVYGMELSQERIDFAEKNGIKIISSENLDQYRFDFINTEQVFEHIPQPFETLQLLTKSLSDVGILKISVPNGNKILNAIKKMNFTAPKYSKLSINPVAPLEHINCYSTKALTIMGKKCDLTPLKDSDFKRIFFGQAGEVLKQIVKPYYKKYSYKGSNCIYFTKTL